MAEMQLEGLGAEALDRIDASDHAQHWGRALAFLRIAAGYYLSDPPQDRESRQRVAAEHLAAAWARGEDLPDGPVVVAGRPARTGRRGISCARWRGCPWAPWCCRASTRTCRRRSGRGSTPGPRITRRPAMPPSWPIRPAAGRVAGAAPDPARNRLISLARGPRP
ncbi:hypothetical protein [Paracoccus mutanolyticus]|uniref:hypothetical protein n=1 Tax=Paracoccus mutanolyticus TaxID=1499308 RepID=UPI001CB891A6|nr:hypothetical protein [Paracoccus mutanolyticus]